MTDTGDPRSYRQNSDRLRSTGFAPAFTVSDAIADISRSFEEGTLPDSPECFSVEWMRQLGLQ